MIVVIALIEFKNRLPDSKLICRTGSRPAQTASTRDRPWPDPHPSLPRAEPCKRLPADHVALPGLLKYFQNLDSWQRHSPKPLFSSSSAFVMRAPASQAGTKPGHFMNRSYRVGAFSRVPWMRHVFVAPRALACPHRSLALAAACSSGCSSLDPSGTILSVVTPYRVDIVQGVMVTRSSCRESRSACPEPKFGTFWGPVAVTRVPADRWDYVFTIRRQARATAAQHRRLAETTEVSTPVAILPAEIAFVASIDSNKSSARRWH